MERIALYLAGGLIVLYITYKLLGKALINKLIHKEFEQVLNSDEYKVKGRFE